MTQAPKEIKLRRKSKTLEIVFDDKRYPLPFEFLRVHSPSAEVRGHGKGQEKLQLNKQDVTLTGIEPQGNYAIRLIFDDGHDSGIYTWPYLHELGVNHDTLWQTYQERVEQHSNQTSAVKWVTSPSS